MSKTLLPLAALLLLIIGYIGSLYSRVHIMQQRETQEDRQIQANQTAYFTQLAAHTKDRLAKEAADTYGGATPEDTWKLFIAALEKGDADLAAKYFVVDKQEEGLMRLRKSKELGNLQKYARLINIEKSGVYQDKEHTYYTYTTVPVDSDGIGMSFELTINPQTHVWKIIRI